MEVHLLLSFYTISTSQNILLTGLIIGRLFYARRRIQVFGEDQGRSYNTLSAIFIESQAVYTIWGIVLVTMALSVPQATVYLVPPLGNVAVSILMKIKLFDSTIVT